MYKVAFISQPMNNLPEDKILEVRRKTCKKLSEMGYLIIPSYFDDTEDEYIVNGSVYFIGKSIEAMSKCNLAYFCKGWEKARGCRIEHEVAEAYGVNIMYEEE